MVGFDAGSTPEHAAPPGGVSDRPPGSTGDISEASSADVEQQIQADIASITERAATGVTRSW
jgi:hypothetical protein